MLFEWRTYHFAPGKALAYLEDFRANGLARVTRHLPMLGYWLTECGRLNTLHHLWVYADLDHRAGCRAALAGDREWTEGFGPRAFPMIERQETLFLKRATATAAFDAAVAVAGAARPRRDAPGPVLAPSWAMLEIGDPPPPGEDRIAVWDVVAGERPGTALTLRGWETGIGPEAFAPRPLLRRELMRPCAFSPLR